MASLGQHAFLNQLCVKISISKQIKRSTMFDLLAMLYFDFSLMLNISVKNTVISPNFLV